MGSAFSQFFFRNKPNQESHQFSAYSSFNYNRKGSKSHFQNHKNSYMDLNQKYQLSNQRWTTIRQFEKLAPMVMRNFSKSLERGKNNQNTIKGIRYDENSETNRNNEFQNIKQTENCNKTDSLGFFLNKNYEISQTKTKRETTNLFLNNDKINDFLDHSNHLLLNQEIISVDYEGNNKNANFTKIQENEHFPINILDNINDQEKHLNHEIYEKINNHDLEVQPKFGNKNDFELHSSFIQE